MQSFEIWSSGFFQPPTDRQHVYNNLRSRVNYGVGVRAWSPIGAGEYSIVTTTGTVGTIRIIIHKQIIA